MKQPKSQKRELSLGVLIGILGLACLLALQAPALADVEDVLLERGTITKEEWLKIKADKEKEQLTQAGKGLEYRVTDLLIPPYHLRIHEKHRILPAAAAGIVGPVEAAGLHGAAIVDGDLVVHDAVAF